MEILYVLIPLSIILVGVAIRVFIWAVRNDQFDDLEGPAHSILFDDDDNQIPPESRKRHSSTDQSDEDANR